MRQLYQIFFLVTFALVVSDKNVFGARILGVFPAPAPSHYILGGRLMKELAARGHQVTVISPFDEKKPIANYRGIVLTGYKEQYEKQMQSFFENVTDASMTQSSPIIQFFYMITAVQNLFGEALVHTNVEELLKSNEKFDLVIMAASLNEAHSYFAERFDCPLIILSTIGSNVMINNYVKNPEPSSYISSGNVEDLTFWKRMVNLIITSVVEGMHVFYGIPSQNKLLHTLYPDAPHVNDIIRKRTSLVLLNSHPSFGVAKPLLPNMIEIGGYHIEEPKTLPKDLQEYLDGAKNGFILFSLGSNVKSSMLPEKMRNDIMFVFAKLPYKILWKFEVDLPGRPDNVKISKWLPQNDILAHPNLRLFITHGGLLSTTEAVYHGVPLVGIPIFGDQKMNMAQSERLGIGITVQFSQLNEETLLSAIHEVLNNKNYRENVRHRSKLFRDQPMRPIDTAIFWIEYILRNGYSPHLRISGMNMDWYQIRQIDVIIVITLAGIVSLIIVKKIITRICCCRKSGGKSVSNKKKKQ